MPLQASPTPSIDEQRTKRVTRSTSQNSSATSNTVSVSANDNADNLNSPLSCTTLTPGPNIFERPVQNSCSNVLTQGNKFFGDFHQLELIYAELNGRVNTLSNQFKENKKMILTLSTCVSNLVEGNNVIKQQISSITNTTSEILSSIKQMKSALKISDGFQHNNQQAPSISTPINANTTTSYAAIAKQNVKNKVPKHAVVIKPNNEAQECKATFKHIRENISPTNKEISSVRHTTKGTVVIHCNSKEAVNALEKDAIAKLGTNYKISVPEKKMPKIRAFGISEKLSEHHICAKLRQQNSDIFDLNSHIEIHSVFGVSNSSRFGFKMSCDPETYSKVLNASTLRVGWDYCRVTESIDFIRCYNCSSYHHVKAECKSKTVCPKCAEDHSLKDCSSTVEKCINCIRHNERLKLGLDIHHTALSKSCPVYMHLLERQRSRIEYDTQSDTTPVSTITSK